MKQQEQRPVFFSEILKKYLLERWINKHNKRFFGFGWLNSTKSHAKNERHQPSHGFTLVYIQWVFVSLLVFISGCGSVSNPQTSDDREEKPNEPPYQNMLASVRLKRHKLSSRLMELEYQDKHQQSGNLEFFDIFITRKRLWLLKWAEKILLKLVEDQELVLPSQLNSSAKLKQQSSKGYKENLKVHGSNFNKSSFLYRLDSFLGTVFMNFSGTENQRKLLWFLALNVVVMVAEVISGLLASNLGLAGDGLHMAVDCLGVIGGLIASNLAQTSRNRRYPLNSFRMPFGWQRIEPLFVLINNLVLLVLMVELMGQALWRLPWTDSEQEPSMGFHDQSFVWVAVVGLAVNLYGVFAFHEFHDHAHHNSQNCGHKNDDDHHHHHESKHSISDESHNWLMDSIYLHVLADTLTSVCALFSIWVGYAYTDAWWPIWLDSGLALVCGFVVCWQVFGSLNSVWSVMLMAMDIGDSNNSGDKISAEFPLEVLEFVNAGLRYSIVDLKLFQFVPGELMALARAVTVPDDEVNQTTDDAAIRPANSASQHLVHSINQKFLPLIQHSYGKHFHLIAENCWLDIQTYQSYDNVKNRESLNLHANENHHVESQSPPPASSILININPTSSGQQAHGSHEHNSSSITTSTPSTRIQKSQVMRE